MKKYSKGFTRDYDFYLKSKDRFTFAGVKVDGILFDETGVSAKEAFYRQDTKGETMVSTREPDLLKEIITCKKSINLHIKMWVEGYEDMMEGVEYYLENCVQEPPPWVEDSFRKQLRRRFKRNDS